MSFVPKDLDAFVRARVGQLLPNGLRIGRLLGEGAMAAVYGLESPKSRPLAIKILHSHLTRETMIRERFRREAYAAKLIHHPGVVHIRGDGMLSSGEPFLVMDRIMGETLEDILSKPPGAIDTCEVLRIASEVLHVLAAAHAAGVLHRDIKPANLMLNSDGAVRVLDFGLARFGMLEEWGTDTQTATGVLLGTAAYISPEQAAGDRDRVGPPSDVFSVGAVMFRAISGQLLHPGRNLAERMQHAHDVGTRSLADVAPFTRKDVIEIVDRSLRSEISERYRSVTSMRRAVEAARALQVSQPRLR